MHEGRELLPFWPRRLGWILLTEVMQEQKVRGRANCALGKLQLRCLRTLGGGGAGWQCVGPFTEAGVLVPVRGG